MSNIIHVFKPIPQDIIQQYVSQLTDNEYLIDLYQSLFSARNDAEKTEIGVNFWNEVKKMTPEKQMSIQIAYLEATKQLPKLLENFKQRLDAVTTERVAA